MKLLDSEQLTLFPVASRDCASPSQSPDSAGEPEMKDSCGLRCAESSENSGPLGLLVKMCLESSLWRSTEYSLTWKECRTPAGRLYYRLLPSTLRTDGTESALWPTMTANDGKNVTLPPAAMAWDSLPGEIARQMLFGGV